MRYRPLRNVRREPAPPAPTPPSTAMLIENGEADRGVFGSFGEMLSPAPDSPVVVEPGRPLVIEPPDWPQGDLVPSVSDQAGELTALQAMKLADRDDSDEPPAWGPPVPPMPPLIPVAIPPVDWRQEERLRLQAQGVGEAVEEMPSRYPPPTREQL